MPTQGTIVHAQGAYLPFLPSPEGVNGGTMGTNAARSDNGPSSGEIERPGKRQMTSRGTDGAFVVI